MRGENCPAHEILRVLLRLVFTAETILLDCLECIKSDVISGRSAIFCISEMQQHICTYYMTEKADSQDYLVELFRICTDPFMINADPEKMTVCSVFLELVPGLFTAVATSNDSGKKSTCLCRGMVRHLLDTEWLPNSYVLLFNLMNELNRFLRKGDIRRLQVNTIYFECEFHVILIQITCSSGSSNFIGECHRSGGYRRGNARMYSFFRRQPRPALGPRSESIIPKDPRFLGALRRGCFGADTQSER